MAFLNGGMGQNRIRELRKARGMTLEELAEAVEMSASHISRLENGDRELMVPIAKKIAQALDSTASEVLGFGPSPPLAINAGFVARTGFGQFTEEFAIYEPPDGDPMSAFKGPNRYLFKLSTDALEKAGYLPGDIVVVDDSQALCTNPPPLSAVRVRYHLADDFLNPKTLLRQFVPPRLLVTNRRGGNAAPIDMDEDDAHIVGVIVHSHRRAQGVL